MSTPDRSSPRQAPPRRGAAGLLALLLLVLAGAATAVAVLGRSEAGTRWLFSQVPGLTVTGLSGALLGDELRVAQLRWRGGGAADAAPQLAIDDLRLDGMVWAWRPHARAWVGLAVADARAQRVAWRSAPSTQAPQAPTSLVLPLQLDIASAQIARLEVDALPPVTDLAARIALGSEGGTLHRLDGLQATLDRARLSGEAQIGTGGALAVDAALQARSHGSSRPWQAELEARGPLARLQVLAHLRGEGGQAGPALQAQGRLAPFDAWPLPELELTTAALDLAELASAAPHTRIDGHARIRSQGLQHSAELTLALDNQDPGAWDADRLPLRRVALTARGTPGALTRLDIAALAVELADRQGLAGRLSGSGHWDAEGLALQTQWDDLQPGRLDARLAALRLSGPVALQLRGLPPPQALAGGAPTAAVSADALSLTLDARLGGIAHLTGSAGTPVRLALQGRASARELVLTQAVAEAGTGALAARAQGTLQARRSAPGAPWQLRSDGTLARFDPRLWWPGAEGSAWRQGPHRLEGRWEADLALPADWRQARGRAALTLDDSQLAGVVLAGQVSLVAAGGQADAQAELRAADARLQLQGRLAAKGEDDRWTVQVDWPRAAALAPLARLAPALAPWWPVAGSLRGSAQVSGRWPLLATQGELVARGLRAAGNQAGDVQARWQLGTSDDAPWDVQLEASALARGEQRVDRLSASLSGTRRTHAVNARVESPLRPPAWAESVLGPSGTGTRLQLQGQGAWQPEGDGSRWRGQLTRFDLAARTARDNGKPWFDARGFAADLRFDAQGGLAEAAVASGRALLPGGAALRWDEARWRDGAPDDLQVVAEIEPLAIAPLLAQAQPHFGWSGDLRLGARIELRARERFQAEIVAERTEAGGDLRITDDAGSIQALGLTDLRLGLAALDGQWTFTVAAAGQQLGEMAGAVVVRTTPERRWPDAQAPMEGVIEMRVANLGAWGAWVPPGWRLAGNLRTSAIFGGRFGAPEVRGEMRGQNLGVRNVLEGVVLSDGELAVTLEGATARIDTFRFKGGEGTLALTGGATLGDEASLQLAMTAERFRLLGRVDRRLTASGRASLAAQGACLQLEGALAVDEGLFDFSRADAPSLDSDVSVRQPGQTPEEAEAAAPHTPRTLHACSRVDVRIDLGRELRLRGRGLDTRLAGELRVSRATGGTLAVNGTVRTQGGTYVAYGQRMEVERGEVEFAGSTANPRLDIRAVRPNLDVRVGVAVGGTAQSPRIRLFSEPEMADLDKLSWLVLGRAPDGLGRTDTALLQRAAVALLAGEGEAPADSLLNTLGLTDFSLRQTDGEVRETVVSLGRQLSRRWYVGYERSMNATAGTWQLIYRAAQRFTLRAQSGQENAIDLIWQWRW